VEDFVTVRMATAHPTNTPAWNQNHVVALHWRILIGLVLGAVAGLVARRFWPPAADGATDARLEWVVANVAEVVGNVFLNLIFMVVIPLAFSALVLGIAEIGDVRKLGRMGLRTFLMTLLLSGASVAIGLTLANTIRPGDRLSLQERDRLREQYQASADDAVGHAPEAKLLRDTLLDLIPRNPFREMVGAVEVTVCVDRMETAAPPTPYPSPPAA
jgi:dicarboxylate/amino acid:cation (Na+ or H+) symporter, DAACS family